jgi:long-subunit acyl-CoA synthetase (AMP-forming)
MRDTGASSVQRESPSRHAVFEGRTVRTTLEPEGSAESIGSFLMRSAERFSSRTILRRRVGESFDRLTWEAFHLDVIALGHFLFESGVEAGDRVAVVSPNRVDMLITEFAVMSIGAVYTPIFAGYTAAQVGELIAHAGANVVFLAQSDQLGEIALSDAVRRVVIYDDPDPWTDEPSDEPRAFDVHSFADVVARLRPRDDRDPAVAVIHARIETIDPTSPCLMMYTSGTSGRQKGVLLSHDNILSQQRALARLWHITPDDRFLSYLPWHHSFGGIFEKYTALFNGAEYAIDDSLGKDVSRLLENWKRISPTVYFSVPKIFQALFNHVRTCPEDEDMIFRPDLKFVFTAAAALPANIAEYFAARGLPVVEGWGLTETSPCCSITDLEEPRSIAGAVGYPIPGVELRLADDNEILVRGPNVTCGYHGDSEATAAVLPGDGWFRTGDLGEFVETGLRLVSRKDRVFKLFNAEKVIPTAIENGIAGRCPYIQHVIVVGSNRTSLAAIVFPNFFLIDKEFGSDRARAEEVVRGKLRDAILDTNRANPVKYEHIEAFAVVSRELSVERGELTPSTKVRVNQVLESCQDVLEAIYEPAPSCNCDVLRKVMRLLPDERGCFQGHDLTLDQCHRCGAFIFDETDA